MFLMTTHLIHTYMRYNRMFPNHIPHQQSSNPPYRTRKSATFTIQLGGGGRDAKTAAGNTDIYNPKKPRANLQLTT
ncbi:hypothetical protein B9Z19DRAFT_1096630 [Tuber borchii]|uniref:Uncharacterized protein n=1 Tax=Tuber borchii TaxID=42251 RepID=A0A2T6ZB84_TUBBO|nr:hypothetical protein B9Z19DRAFT_1096630 [Tuber borchii]